MAVAFVGGVTNTTNTAGGSTITFSYSVGSGSDRLLLAQIRGADSVSGVTYAGAGMTDVGTAGNMTMWRKTAPASGANNIVISTVSYSSALSSVSDWSGVDQTTPLGTAVTSSGTGLSGSTASITCPPDGAIFGGIETAYSVSPGTITGQSGTTLVGFVRNAANGWTKAGGRRTTTGGMGFDLATTSRAYAIQAFPINPAVSFTAKLPQVYSQAIQGSVI